MNILTMGEPDAGKGTMSIKIVEKFSANHISTGDVFRSEVGKGTALGMEAKSFMNKGLLAPDGAVSNTVESYLEELEDRKSSLLLDGYPRILDQAKAFDVPTEGNEFVIDRVTALEIDSEKLAGCVTGRRICKECGEIYHIKSEPSKIDNACDVCGGGLFQRKDNTVGNLTVRLEGYSSQATPMLDYYDSKETVTGTNASQPTDSIWNDTLTALEKQEQ